jgi:Uma2 family endonuclease
VTVEWGHDWRPPEDGVTAANLYRLPGLALPPHTELIDGGLFFSGPPQVFHESALKLLCAGLAATLPDGLLLRTRKSLTLELRTRVEPDILVLAADAQTEADQTECPADALLLAVEVVAPISEIRDRELKPKLYINAGITHFWRVEEEGGKPVVYIYELSPVTSDYFLTGTYHDTVKLNVPYEIDIDLSSIGEL